MAVINGDAENNTLDGTGAADTINGLGGGDILNGLDGNDTLEGGDGNDRLQGGAGADTLNGGAGAGDSVAYDDSAAAVSINLATGSASGGDAVGDQWTGIEGVQGSAFNDTIVGDVGSNRLWGLAGDDTLNGGDGNDVLNGHMGADHYIGGNGFDVASYTYSAAGVTINLATGETSGGDATGDTFEGIEQIYGSQHADTLIGDAAANSLYGGLGTASDVLEGRGGADEIIGGGGTDTASYAASAAGVTINLAFGVGAGGDAEGDTLSGIENLTGSALADYLRGDAAANALAGGDGNDGLDGIGGADALDGGAGIDTAYYITSAAGVTVDLAAGTGSGGDAEGDTLAGIEQVIGSNENDVLTGDSGGNGLWGGDGGDVLTGGAGADALKGGAGNDVFAFTNVADSTVASTGKDLISDFATGDRIDLSAIDADGNAGNGDTAFSFGTGGFTGVAGELRVVEFGEVHKGVYLDVDGDRTPDSIINVYADHALTAADFVL